MITFEEATREKTKARIALAGPAGSGKTRWALEIAQQLGQNIAVIDTENKSASLYVGVNGLRFKACNLSNFSIQNYLDAMAAAERAGFDVIVIDSLSHAWAGEGGALEQVDKLKGNNAFTNGWGTVTPLQNKLTNALTQCGAHLIVTLQSHQEYVLEEQVNRQGRKVQVPVRKGLAPVQRKGMEYLFSLYAEVELEDHSLNITKTRLDPIKNGKVSVNELVHFAQSVRLFHDSGAEPETTPREPAATNPAPASAASRAQGNGDRYKSYWPLFRNSSHVKGAEGPNGDKIAPFKGDPLASLDAKALAEYIVRLEKGLATQTEKAQATHPDARLYLAAAIAEHERREADEAEAALAFKSGDPDDGRPF